MKKQILIISSIFSGLIIQAQVKPDIINSSGNSTQYAGGYLAWSVGEPIIGEINTSNKTINQGFLQSWDSRNKTLFLTLYLEGLWNGNYLNKTQDEYGDHFGSDTADLIDIILHDTVNYLPVLTFNNIELSTSGIAMITFERINSDYYYIAVLHRNHLETWSSIPVLFINDTTIYNFTNISGNAFGNNQKQIEYGKYALFAGDVNQDGLIDGSDMSDTETDNNTFAIGYIVTDINGDGLVDGSDMSIVETNNNNFVGVITPYSINKTLLFRSKSTFKH